MLFLIARGIRHRFLNYVEKKSKGIGVSAQEFAEEVLNVSKASLASIQRAESDPSLALCERVIRDGCDPHYLFFGEFNKAGDPVKCFAKTSRGGCKALTDDALDNGLCPGYKNCKFYKSEARFLAETIGCKNIRKWMA